MSPEYLISGGILAVSLACLLLDGLLFWGRSAGPAPAPWRISIAEFIVFIWVVLFSATMVSILAAGLAERLAYADDLRTGLVVVATQGAWLLTALVFFTVLKGKRDELLDWKPALPLLRGFGLGVFFLFAALPLVFLVQQAWYVFLQSAYPQAAPIQEIVTTLATTESALAMFLLGLGAVGLAPIAEELIFRHGVFRFLIKYLSPNMAAWLSGLLFGLMHLHPIAIVPLTVLGYLFARAYQKTGRLLVPIVMHGLFNAMTVLSIWLPLE
ncbi:MAG: lysostaphin resistance A-like protein [Opitutales bacterium]